MSLRDLGQLFLALLLVEKLAGNHNHTRIR
jgi:hypothetical protein